MTLINPIIPGFAPDPSVTIIGDVYFLVNSSFHLFPGLPVYASKDLVQWSQIGNAINRRSQLSLQVSATKIHSQPDGATLLATGGLYAPTIRHDVKSGKTYVICTNVVHSEDLEMGITENFIVSTNDIWSDEWSDPILFEFKGIDPSITWDNGKAYVCGSAGPGPMTKINLFEVSLSTGEKLSEEKTIWEGTGGIYPEGPHIYNKDGWYYLLISEGGTWKGHMITIARSSNIWGPFESHIQNPILTARDTEEYIQCTGHCDMFQDLQGNWWGVCLGVRMKEERCMMGRESFLIPGKWDTGKWPLLQQVTINPTVKASGLAIESRKGTEWLYIRDAILKDHQLVETKAGTTITLKPSKHDISQWKESVTFVGKRQRKMQGSSSVILDIPQTGDVKAGLVVYKDEHRFARLFYDTASELVFELVNNAESISRVHKRKVENAKSVALRIAYTEDSLCFLAKLQADEETIAIVDTRELSGIDFVGPVVGVFATSNDEQPLRVLFKSFKLE